jgi:hypothetical protein
MEKSAVLGAFQFDLFVLPRLNKGFDQVLYLDNYVYIGSHFPFLKHFVGQLLVHVLTAVRRVQTFVEYLFQLGQVARIRKVNAVKGLTRVAKPVTKFVEARNKIGSDDASKRMQQRGLG